MNTDRGSSPDPALRNLDAALPDLADLYKDVHSHPELSMQETRTAKLAADRLTSAGFEVTSGVGKTGVVGILRNGDGPTVMLRADMDALPVQEATVFLTRARRPPPIERAIRSPCRICAATTCMSPGSRGPPS
jgi:metal-dependent amidase/aminoacylase/carboxypeptidase family protein